MFTKKITISVLTCLLFTVKSYAGFGLETTRLVYHEKNNSEGVVAFNTDKNRNYLLQSWVEDNAGKVSSDFVSTPPLLKLRAEKEYIAGNKSCQFTVRQRIALLAEC